MTDDIDHRRTDLDRGDSLGFLLAVAILLGLVLWICAGAAS